MADYETLFPGRFLKGVEFKGKEYTFTIAGTGKEKIRGKVQAILTLKETEREVAMNRTNAEALVLMFGREMDNWKGKRVTLHAPVLKNPFQGGRTPQIRVKGSPDISQPMSADIERGDQVIRVRVVPTGKGVANGNAKNAAPVPVPAPAPEPEPNPDTGEVPFDGEPPEEFESTVL